MTVCPIAVILGTRFGPWERLPGSFEIGCGVTVLSGDDDGTAVVVQWQRWVPGSRHGLARGAAVYGMPCGPDPGQLDELLGRCERLRSWARTRGFVLSGVPADLALLDQAIGERRHDRDIAALGTEAGLFLGTVIIAKCRGARWRVWPNGHPVVRLASGRELDTVAMGAARVHTGAPRLADAFTDAVRDPQP